MTTPNETKKMPERIAFTSMYGFVDAESQQRPEDQDAFRTELARRWNLHASTIADLQAAIADDAKYPQLRLPDMQRQRIEGALRRLRKPTL